MFIDSTVIKLEEIIKPSINFIQIARPFILMINSVITEFNKAKFIAQPTLIIIIINFYSPFFFRILYLTWDFIKELITKSFNFNLEIMASFININSQKVMDITEFEIIDLIFIIIVIFIMASKIINIIIAIMQIMVKANTLINHYLEEPNFLIFCSFIKAMRLNFLNN